MFSYTGTLCERYVFSNKGKSATIFPFGSTITVYPEFVERTSVVLNSIARKYAVTKCWYSADFVSDHESSVMFTKTSVPFFLSFAQTSPNASSKQIGMLMNALSSSCGFSEFTEE